MLGQLEDAGSGTQVYFGQQLTSIHAAPLTGKRAVRLGFANGNSVTADKVLLNLPGTAMSNLAGVLYSDAATKTGQYLKSVWAAGNNKVYAFYEDAWWNSK